MLGENRAESERVRSCVVEMLLSVENVGVQERTVLGDEAELSWSHVGFWDAGGTSQAGAHQPREL